MPVSLHVILVKSGSAEWNALQLSLASVPTATGSKQLALRPCRKHSGSTVSNISGGHFFGPAKLIHKNV